MQIEKKTLWKIFLCVAGGIVIYWILRDTDRAKLMLQGFWNLIEPFVTGAALAFVFNMPMRAVERWLKWIKRDGLRRACAIVLTLLLLVVCIAFVVELLVPQITLTVDALVARLPEFVRREAANIREFLEANPEIMEWVQEYTKMENLDLVSVLEKVLDIAGDRLAGLADSAVSAIGSLTNGIVNAFVSIVFGFYALSRKEVLARQGRRILYSLVPENAADEIVRILRLANSTFSNFFTGQCLEAGILGCLFAVSMAILGMPYIPLVSVIIAITALVPLVGAFVGCILGAVFIMVESPVQAFTFVVMFLVLQQIEGNLIYPRVVGTSIGLPGMWVLAALTIGGELMGVMGMLVMIPLASVAYALIGEYTQKRVQELHIDPDKLRDHPPELKSKFKEKREKRREQRLLRKMKELAEKGADHLMHKTPPAQHPEEPEVSGDAPADDGKNT